MQRCVESLETYFILGQKSSPLSLAINYIYLYRLEQVHVQQLPVHIELSSDKSVPPPSFLMLGSRPQRFCVVGRFCLCCDGTQDLVHLLDPRRAVFFGMG